jgi:hypothetical protein
VRGRRDAVAHRGRVRGDLAIGKPHVEAEVVDDPVRQQADQVRVRRQPDVDALEDLPADGGATDLGKSLENEDGPAGPGEVGGRDEAVVPPTDHDDVVPAACHRRTVTAGRQGDQARPRSVTATVTQPSPAVDRK